MSEETMEMRVDDPSNGMMLDCNIHNVFHMLKVYLEQGEVSLTVFHPTMPCVD